MIGSGLRWMRIAVFVIAGSLCVALFLQGQSGGVAMYAVLQTGGLVRSDDGGQSWQAVLTGEAIGAPSGFSAFAVSPKDATRLIVGRSGFATKALPGIARPREIYRSADRGTTWMKSTAPTPTTIQLVIDSNRPETIYLGGEEGVYRSLDSGANWTLVAPYSHAFAFASRGLALDPSKPGVLYGTMAESGLVRSSDFGATWNTIAARLGSGNSFPEARDWNTVAVDPANSSVLYLPVEGTCRLSSGVNEDCGLFRSITSGSTWERVPVPGPVRNVQFDVRNKTIYAAGRIQRNPQVGESGRSVIHRSADDGRTWTTLTITQAPSTGAELTLDPVDPMVIYARILSSPPTYYVSPNQGSNWNPIPIRATGIPTTDAIQVLHSVPSGAPSSGVRHVSAASFRSGPLAPDSIATALGSGLASGTESASTGSTLSLAGTRINIIDSGGRSRLAPLFFASPGQINYLIPSDVALGLGSVVIERTGASALTQPVEFSSLSPGMFVLNSASLAAASVLRVRGAEQISESVYLVDAAGVVVARPIDLNPGTDQVFLLIFGTGFRSAGTAAASVSIGGQAAEVQYSGPQGSFSGLDQINVRIPAVLGGAGQVEVRVSINGIPANTTFITVR